MPRHVLAAWELGGGYGHVARLLPVADGLAALGHRVTLGLFAPETAKRLGGQAHRVVRAPVYTGPPLGGAAAGSFPEMLLSCGFDSVERVTALVGGWLALFAADRPDLVLADYAPSALLAARVAGITAVSMGCGWTAPPATTPMPPLAPWDDVPPARLAASEERVLGTVNAALLSLGGRPLAALQALYPPEDVFLCTFPELDHYEGRGAAGYLGPIFMHGDGAEPVWPAIAGPRIFAYVNARHPAFPGLLRGLERVGAPTVMHARDGDAAVYPPNVWLAPGPVRLDAALAEADLVISQGINTLSAALLAGRPVVSVPEHGEQLATAARVIRQGFGLALAPDDPDERIVQVLRRVLDDPRFNQSAMRFARHYHGYSPAMAVRAIVENCADILEG